MIASAWRSSGGFGPEALLRWRCFVGVWVGSPVAETASIVRQKPKVAAAGKSGAGLLFVLSLATPESSHVAAYHLSQI